MVKANNTIFQFYLAMMDFFGKYLSEKYPNSSSIEDTKHYQTIIIERIVQMFHSLELLTKDTLDEVSARCVLRGILDSVTIYSFIYQRTDVDDMLFRHYLYALDGWREYKMLLELLACMFFWALMFSSLFGIIWAGLICCQDMPNVWNYLFNEDKWLDMYSHGIGKPDFSFEKMFWLHDVLPVVPYTVGQ